MSVARTVDFDYLYDPSVEDQILMLFFGIFDERTKGKPFPTQEDISTEIKIASNGKYAPTQSAVSKKLRYLLEVPLCFNGDYYQIVKAVAGYKLFSRKDILERNLQCLYDIDPFEEDDIFYNSNTAPSIFAFKLKPSCTEIERTRVLLTAILGDACFDIACMDSLMVIFLNINSDSFKYWSEWLKEYREFLQTWDKW